MHRIIGGDMKQRIISAIVMLIIFIPILITGGLPFYILSFLLGLISLYELLKLNKKIPIIVKILTYIFTGLLIIYDIKNTNFNIIIDGRLFIFMLLVYLSLLVLIDDKKKYNYKDAFYLIGISLFIGISFNNFIHIRNIGINLVIYLFLITTITDSFALFIGKLFGKRKLAPSISPNKTVEGLIGGSVVGSVAASLFYIFIIKDYTNIFIVILLTLFLSLMGQMGDLIKSSIKRYENIKDFSNLIPGHGGILDRLDSIIFVMMTYILISNLF